MSSYADAAKTLGPAKVEKIPEPAKVESTSTPHGSVETIDGKEFDKKRKEAAKEVKRVASEAAKASKEQAEVIKEELDELEKKLAPYFEKVVGFLQEKYAAFVSTVNANVNKDTLNQASEELQNPVVLSQLALIAGGATAGYFVYSERAHIRLENKYVVAIHAGLVTALVLGDVYVFQKMYPKYKK